MNPLGSLKEEDLVEICIDNTTEQWSKKSSPASKSRSSFHGTRDLHRTSSPVSRRSHSQPDIHIAPFSTMKPNELCFSCDIPQAKYKYSLQEKPDTHARPSYLYGEPLPLQRYAKAQHFSSVTTGARRRTIRFHPTRFDPCPPEEKMKSLQCLLTRIYHEESMQSSTRDLTDSLTESFQSDVSITSPKRLTAETLAMFGVPQLQKEVADLESQIEQANFRLVRMVRQRAFYRAKQNRKCAVLSAILMALSSKTRADSKLKFSLIPPTYEGGVEEWKRAMRVMARLPGGFPQVFRNKLWSTLGQLHVQTTGLDWEEICRITFCEHLQPDDIEIHSQIIKDLHRTGWSEFDDEKKLKQVLVAYARYNKEIGYCQGFNVIAALILQVVDYRTDIALKIMIFLIEHVLPRSYFDQSLRALSVDMSVMKDLMLQRVPQTFEHLEKLKNSSGNEYEPPLPNIFSMHWFLTLFATCLPRECVLRLWDALMLQGSEILLRAAIALWSKMSRKIMRTTSADEFYTLMGKLCKELTEMNEEEQNHFMTVVYTMAEFPYPGLAELREKYTWNIHPLSATFKLFRRSVTDILYDDSSDGEPSCSPCSCRRRKDAPTWSDLRELEKRYKLIKQRQKQARVILNSAYLHGLNAYSTRSKVSLPSLPTRTPPVFNHLILGPLLARIDCTTEPPTTFSGGAVKVAATVIQPADHTMSRLKELLRELSLEENMWNIDTSSNPSRKTSRAHSKRNSRETTSSDDPEDVNKHQTFTRSTDSKASRRARLRRSKTLLQQASPAPALRHSIRLKPQRTL
ncbi:unnamed protein product [Cylicocyclus nassatus]|uniref:Rab-GAP TBC domain-containing protein n=1 Tax=Cylicocyclus nassatus TaxID=53992 RepID=A0AA36M759_CYLNA|nr:unnamed protein product [Cylicocyclus nassatus]